MGRALPISLSLVLAACGSSSGQADAGPPVTAQAYYGLVAGKCFEYADMDGGAATLGLVIEGEASGVGMQLSRHGQEIRTDYLSFDGGIALLTQQDFISGGVFRTRTFATPLAVAQAPLATSQPALDSSSSYSDDVNGIDGGSGKQTWETDVLAEQAFTCEAGAYPTAFELQFVVSDSAVDGGAPGVLERRWVAPNTGFVSIYTTNDTGQYVNYGLVDVKPADGGCAANP